MSTAPQAATAAIGIDVAKLTLDAHAAPQGARLHTPNTPAGIADLARWIEAFGPAIVVVEATGGYERLLHRELAQRGFAVALVNPSQARHFAKANGRLAKTDRADAQTLAQMGLALGLRTSPAPTAQQLHLRELAARRRAVSRAIAAESCRLEQTPDAHVRGFIQEHLDFLRNQLARIQELLREATRDAASQAKLELLLSAPGIGEVSAWTLLTEMPELGALGPHGHKKAAALLGVAPVAHDSGQHRGQRSIRGGRAAVRACLYMATLSAVRRAGALRTFYLGLVERGKAKKAALVASMRKLIVRLNAMLRDGTPWSPAPHPQPSILPQTTTN